MPQELTEEDKQIIADFLKKPLREKIHDIGIYLGVFKRPKLTPELRASLEELTGPLPEGFDWANIGKWPPSEWERLIKVDPFVSKRLGLKQEYHRRNLMLKGASDAESRFIVRDSPYSYSLSEAKFDDIIDEMNDPELTRKNSLAVKID